MKKVFKSLSSVLTVLEESNLNLGLLFFMVYLFKLCQYERLVSLEAQLELSLDCTKFDDQINMNGHECYNA